MNVKELVKGQMAHFMYYQDGSLYYETDNGFKFPIPLKDAGSAVIGKTEKAILLMRYIRKHLELRNNG